MLKKESLNFTDSIKKIQRASVLLHRRYSQKPSTLNFVVIKTEEDKQNPVELQPSLSKNRSRGSELSEISEGSDDFNDVDEGDVDIRTQELKRKGSNSVASKCLMTQSGIDLSGGSQIVQVIKEERGVDYF